MSLQKPFAMHYQDVWSERAQSPRLPAWVRVAALAYGKHGASGHATFRAGEVAKKLGSTDSATGERVPMARQNVHRAIRAAVDQGWLAEGSSSRCLIVPQHAVYGGDPRAASAYCPVHQELMVRDTNRNAALGRRRARRAASAKAGEK